MSREPGCSCGCLVMIIILIINLTLGGLCFDYTIYNWFNADIAWPLDCLCGMVLGEIVMPCAIVTWILKCAGVQTPFFVDKSHPTTQPEKA